MVKIHEFDSTGEAYDASQCDESIDNGDVLVVASEGVVGVLYKAWPVAVTERAGNFEKPADGYDVATAFPEEDYSESLRVAREEIAKLPARSPTKPITVTYESVDRYRESRGFDAIDEARAWAAKWVRKRPDLTPSYAVSADGIGKVMVAGAALSDLFPGAT